MPIKTLSSREFSRDTRGARKAAADGPVFIADRGRPAHVLLSIEQYWRLGGERRSIVESLSMVGLSEIELEFPRAGELSGAADFS